MKFHAPSFIIGVATAVAYHATQKRLRPVVVELASLGLHVARISRGMIERQREDVEDFWAEVLLRARGRARGVARAPSPIEPRPNAATPASQSAKAG